MDNWILLVVINAYKNHGDDILLFISVAYISHCPRQKMNGKKHGSSTESEEPSEIELSSDEDDSDDPSWGRKRKKKNDARGKKKRKKF